MKTLKITFKHTKRDRKGYCKYDFLCKGINKGGIIVKLLVTKQNIILTDIKTEKHN